MAVRFPPRLSCDFHKVMPSGISHCAGSEQQRMESDTLPTFDLSSSLEKTTCER
jgi:hypothetical protein